MGSFYTSTTYGNGWTQYTSTNASKYPIAGLLLSSAPACGEGDVGPRK
jgi:hypothetical protein